MRLGHLKVKLTRFLWTSQFFNFRENEIIYGEEIGFV